jgi:hypothetical protein
MRAMTRWLVLVSVLAACNAPTTMQVDASGADASLDAAAPDGGQPTVRDAGTARDAGGADAGEACRPAPGDYCAEYYRCALPTEPSFRAFGFERVDVPFETIWEVEPGQPGVRRALPGHFVNPSANRFLSIPFVMTAAEGPLSQFTFSAIEAANLEGIVTGGVSATISPCPGDFRPRDPASSDVYLSAQCRNSLRSSLQFNLTVTSNEGQSGCLAPPGRVMYLNIATHDMYRDPEPSESTCRAADTCGVSMRLL